MKQFGIACYPSLLYSADTRYSVDSTDSKSCLLGKPACGNSRNQDELVSSSATITEDEFLFSMLDRQARNECPYMRAQRVSLTPAKRRDIQVAEVVSTINKMSALRFANQDYLSKGDRRANDMEGFMVRMDRLTVDTLNHHQRYIPA